MGYDLFDILQIACINPVDHYSLRCGTLRKGEEADFIIVKDLKTFEVLSTYIDGECVIEKKEHNLSHITPKIINCFNVSEKSPADFKIKEELDPFPVICAIDGELITEKQFISDSDHGNHKINIAADILKIAVVNRYKDARSLWV